MSALVDFFQSFATEQLLHADIVSDNARLPSDSLLAALLDRRSRWSAYSRNRSEDNVYNEVGEKRRCATKPRGTANLVKPRRSSDPSRLMMVDTIDRAMQVVERSNDDGDNIAGDSSCSILPRSPPRTNAPLRISMDAPPQSPRHIKGSKFASFFGNDAAPSDATDIRKLSPCKPKRSLSPTFFLSRIQPHHFESGDGTRDDFMGSGEECLVIEHLSLSSQDKQQLRRHH